jgi:hypothetical protein
VTRRAICGGARSAKRGGDRGRQIVGVFGVVQKDEIVRPGAVERADARDAAGGIGAFGEGRAGPGGEIGEAGRRGPAEKDRIGHRGSVVARARARTKRQIARAAKIRAAFGL